MKWRLAFGVLCYKNMPPKLKRKFYRAVIKLTILYGAEFWPVKNFHVQKMKVTEIRDEGIWDKVGVAPMEDNMCEARLRWLEHMKRRCTDAPERRCEWLVLRI